MNPPKAILSADQSRRTIVIVGAGPAGSALAIRLRKRNIPVVLVDADKPPPLLVGESLIPAVIPHLEQLGVADAVAAIGVRKPGASLIHPSGERADFRFRCHGKRAPDYAWNVPRPRFDSILVGRARALGARQVSARARLISTGEHEVALDKATRARIGLSAQPGLIIDASGRARAVSRALGLSATRGGRDDVACFAHYRDVTDPDLSDGRIVISILEQGWSWRIPLPDRVSVGVVVPRTALADAGGSAAAVLDGCLLREPSMHNALGNARRISQALRYDHYQLVGERASGSGWAALGDAFGFVDPMLSPGVFMALESAEQLDNHIHESPADGTPALHDALHYEAQLRSWFDAWTHVIETFYDGRMLALQRAARIRGQEAGRLSVHPLVEHIARHSIARLVSGAGTRSPWAQGILARSARYLLRDVAPGDAAAAFAVQDSSSTTAKLSWAASEPKPVPFA